MNGELPRFGDFTHFYVGACMAGTAGEYDAASVMREQLRLTGAVQNHLISSRLPFYYGMLRPLCSFSYVTGHRLWLVFQLAAAASAIALLFFSQGEMAIVASLWSAPLFLSMLGSQDDALIYLVLAASLWLRKAERPVSAGIVLSLLWIKFHLFLVLPILFLIKREFRLLAGALFGSALLCAMCFVVAGWNWPVRYAAVVLNPVIGPGSDAMPNLHGIASHFAAAIAVEAGLAILILVCSVWVFARSNFSVSFGAALLSGILISHHAYAADCAVLVPGFVAVWEDGDSLSRKIAFICILPFVYWVAELLNYGWVPAVLFISLLASLTASKPKSGAVV